MQNVILTLDQNQLDPTVPADNRANYYIRHAARAVLTDESGRVALMYASKKDYHKLPGGGIEEGEDILEALARELLEETGSQADVVREIGIVLEWRDSDNMHQISYAYEATKKGSSVPPTFMQDEIDEGFELKWASDLDEAIRLVESNREKSAGRISFMTRRDAAILRAVK